MEDLLHLLFRSLTKEWNAQVVGGNSMLSPQQNTFQTASSVMGKSDIVDYVVISIVFDQ